MAAAMRIVNRCTVNTLHKIACSACTNNAKRIQTDKIWWGSFDRNPARHLYTTPALSGLDEFLDKKENWTEKEVKVGRPWKPDELRLKSNIDLHKLWYVLLKERNMLMTMEEEYKRLNELMPNPDRIYKVEESMENILDVVEERDRAYHLLEHGETGEGGMRPAIDVLGRDFKRHNKEHYIPYEMSHYPKIEHKWKWQEKFLKLAEEKKMKEADGFRLRSEKRKKELKKIFPNADID